MTKTGYLLSSFLLVFSFSSIIQAQTVALKADHPTEYTVVKGDSLWSIASKFLQKPWQWPQIWHANQQIKNPHLIYPGDRLGLRMVDGQLMLSTLPGSVVKLSPSIRTSVIDQAIPSIPIDAIHQFLSRPFVIADGELDDAPYVVSFFGERLMGSQGVYLYIQNLDAKVATSYDIVRPGNAYKDGETGEILGYEALYIGSARLDREGSPAKVYVTKNQQQIRIGDKLIPANDMRSVTAFYPKPPEKLVSGAIISVLGGVSQIGQFQTVVLDRGEKDGVQVGDVLSVFKKGALIEDKTAKQSDADFIGQIKRVLQNGLYKSVQLPDEIGGTLMIFRVFDYVSFALIMEASETLHVGDRVSNPE